MRKFILLALCGLSLILGNECKAFSGQVRFTDSTTAHIITCYNTAKNVDSVLSASVWGGLSFTGTPFGVDGNLIWNIISTPIHGVCSTFPYTQAYTGATWSIPVTISSTLTYVPNTGYRGVDSFQVMLSDDAIPLTNTKWIVVHVEPFSEVICSDSICIGSPITISGIFDTIFDTHHHSSLSGHVVDGISGGMDTIHAHVSNSCGVFDTFKAIRILPIPVISGGDSICSTSGHLFLTDSIYGGVWVITDTTKATVYASGMTGVVTGIAVGTDTIYHTTSTYCGVYTSSEVIHVVELPNPGFVVCVDSICREHTTLCSDTVVGGRWYSSNNNVDLDSLTGILTALSYGYDTISYKVSNICGSVNAYHTLYIDTPLIPIITGLFSLCNNAIIYDTVITNYDYGTWYATTNNTNNFTNLNTLYLLGNLGSVGMDTVTYTISNVCGVYYTSATVSVDSTCDSLHALHEAELATIPLNVYPVPCDGNFTIGGYKNEKIFIYDIMNREVFFKNNKGEIYIENKGLYFVKVGIYTFRVAVI